MDFFFSSIFKQFLIKLVIKKNSEKNLFKKAKLQPQGWGPGGLAKSILIYKKIYPSLSLLSIFNFCSDNVRHLWLYKSWTTNLVTQPMGKLFSSFYLLFPRVLSVYGICWILWQSKFRLQVLLVYKANYIFLENLSQCY